MPCICNIVKHVVHISCLEETILFIILDLLMELDYFIKLL